MSSVFWHDSVFKCLLFFCPSSFQGRSTLPATTQTSETNTSGWSESSPVLFSSADRRWEIGRSCCKSWLICIKRINFESKCHLLSFEFLIWSREEERGAVWFLGRRTLPFTKALLLLHTCSAKRRVHTCTFIFFFFFFSAVNHGGNASSHENH